jgi:hypothetical protein
VNVAEKAPTRGRRLRLILVLAAAVVLPAAAAVLYTYPPGEHAFYPRCVFFVVTGLHCPGCGATRCLHALLHGDLAQALSYNPLLVVLLPALVVGVLRGAYASWTGRPVPGRRLPGWSIQLLFWVIVAFWVLRNVDVYPFTLLTPHALE